MRKGGIRLIQNDGIEQLKSHIHRLWCAPTPVKTAKKSEIRNYGP